MAKNEKFYIFLHCFSYLRCSIRRHFKFCMPIDHSKSQPTDDKLSPKWAWLRHVIHFKFPGPKHTSGIIEVRIVEFLAQTCRLYIMLPKGRHITPTMGVVMVTWLVWNVAVCRDAARRAGSSATAELLVRYVPYNFRYLINSSLVRNLHIPPNCVRISTKKLGCEQITRQTHGRQKCISWSSTAWSNNPAR